MPTLDMRPDGAIVIEADTATEALAEVGARLGSDAEIVSAEKVHRGGWKGFFAREQVQLVARARTGMPPAPASATAATPAGEPAPEAGAETVRPAGHGSPDVAGLDAVLARMMQQEETQETAFQEVLIRELALAGGGPAAAEAAASVDEAASAAGPRLEEPVPAPVAAVVPEPVPAPVAAVVPEPVPAPVAAVAPEPAPAPEPGPAELPVRSPSGVAWSLERLRALRLPDVVVDACDGLDPADDAAWLLAIAGAVSSWCRPLPARDCLLVGPRAHRLAAGLGLDVAGAGGLVADDRSVGVRVTDGPTGRGFVSEVRAGRWLHLVAGGTRWQGLLLDDVTAVSWVGDEALPSALEAAGRLGLVLGYGLGAATGKMPVRATPVDVALTVRSLLPRHA